MIEKDTLKSVVQQVNSGKSVPALKLVQGEQNLQTAAVVSKLIRPRDNNEVGLTDEKAQYNINQSQIQAISDSIKARIRDNENIFQLFPDIELAVQILVSSILSPKDMYSGDLIYKAKEPIFSAEILAKLCDVVRSELNNHYKFHEKLPQILRDVLFDTGSYIEAILPESIIDEIINKNRVVSTENFREYLAPIYDSANKIVSMGFLGSNEVQPNGQKVTALESFIKKSNTSRTENSKHPVFKVDNGQDLAIETIEVIDNYNLLKLPLVNDSFTEMIATEIIKNDKQSYSALAQESIKEKKLNTGQMSSLVYKSAASTNKTFIAIPSSTNSFRKSIGRPLALRLPSESVIPIYIPGDESKHVGYFVLIDIDGNPVTLNSNTDYVDGLTGLMSNSNSCSNNGLATALTNKAKKNLIGSGAQPTLDQITKIYSSVIENDLLTRLSNGIYGDNVKIANSETIYRIMLARSLANKYTRLVYVPIELTTYYAFRYFPNGVGKSYLDDIKTLTSIRAILLFAKVFAQVKAAINLTRVNVKLDPEDPDPQKSIELLAHEIMRMRQNFMPLGLNSPVEAMDWIQRAGFEFAFEGHPGLPDVKVDFETKSIQPNIPSSELDELLRKQTYMSMGISPETIDNGFNSEFATTFIANNVLFSKRIIQLQKYTCDHTTPHVQKIVRNDEVILEQLRGIVKENLGSIQNTLSEEEKQFVTENETKFINDLVERFIENIETDLPKPDIASVQAQTQALTDYTDALDKALESWIGSEVVSNDISGELANNIDSVKKIVRHYFIRRWMAENGFMAELSDIVTTNEEGKPTVDIVDMNKSHIEALMGNALKLIQGLLPAKNAVNKDLEKLQVEPGTQDSGSSDSGSDTGSGGGDDFGGSFDLPVPGEDTPPEGGDELPPEVPETPEGGTPPPAE